MKCALAKRAQDSTEEIEGLDRQPAATGQGRRGENGQQPHLTQRTVTLAGEGGDALKADHPRR